jgi:hypothetical protein
MKKSDAPKPPPPWGCLTTKPRPHPFEPEVKDCMCGYDERAADKRCNGCRLQHMESAFDQIKRVRGKR